MTGRFFIIKACSAYLLQPIIKAYTRADEDIWKKKIIYVTI